MLLYSGVINEEYGNLRMLLQIYSCENVDSALDLLYEQPDA